jgi:hypothetical protein
MMRRWRIAMSGANNKAIVLRLIEEVLSNGNLAVVDELIDPNFSLHFPDCKNRCVAPKD